MSRKILLLLTAVLLVAGTAWAQMQNTDQVPPAPETGEGKQLK